MVDWLSELIGGSGAKIIDSVTDGVDKFVTTDEERQQLEVLKGELELEFRKLELDAETQYFNDRASARSMQAETKSKIPGILTILFTSGYFALTAFMLFFLLGKIGIELSQFVTVFISTIFGAFNAIMVQIISFYFGSSQGGEDHAARMSSVFQENAKKTSK